MSTPERPRGPAPRVRGQGAAAWLLALLVTVSCDDPPPAAPPGCDALGVRLAPGEQHVDPAACVVCVCAADGTPQCTPWADCPAQGGGGRLPGRDGAVADAAGPDAPDEGPDAARPVTEDPDGDGQPTDVERVAGTDPFDPDSRAPHFVRLPSGGQARFEATLTPRLQAADLAFVVDATGSMQTLIDALGAELADVALALAPRLPRARYGVGIFRDYNRLGDAGDSPFELLVPLTPDAAPAAAALRSVVAHGGGDGVESAYEALLQVLTGQGYDEDCDGAFDPLADVIPYISHVGDAFGGRVAGVLPADDPRRGKVGGIGFDPSALPIIVLATDAPPRTTGRDETPGGCPDDADATQVLQAALGRGARILTVFTNNGQPPAPYAELAQATGAVARPTPADALRPLVLHWLGGATPLREPLTDGLLQLLGAVRFERADVQLSALPAGVEAQISPTQFLPIEPEIFGRPLPVEITLTAPALPRQILDVTVSLVSPAGIVLDRQLWWVLLE